MVVGDKNQSIYGFRGSDFRVFQNFNNDKDFKNIWEYPLKKNYRSTNKIIQISNKFLQLSDNNAISGNYDSNDGPITEEGINTTIKRYPDKETEASEIVKYIKKLYNERIIKNYSDVAILFYSVKKKHSKRFTDKLKAYDIPYEVLGDGGLFSLEYINALLECFKQISKKENVKNDFLDISVPYEIFDELLPKGPLVIFYKLIEQSPCFKEYLKNNRDDVFFNLGKFSRIIMSQVETFKIYGRGDYMKQFCDNLYGLNEDFLDTEQPTYEFDNSIKLLTLHRAKGLEFPIVIIVGATRENYKTHKRDFVKELFPYYDSELDKKRAFYVGITRAKMKLMVSYYGEPASYVNDLMRYTSMVNIERSDNKGLNAFTNSEKNETFLITSSEIKENVINLTYYKLIEFWKCEFAYKLRFHYDLLVPRTYALTYGSILHTLLYHLNLAIKNKEQVRLNELIENKVPKYLQHYNYKRLLENYLNEFKEELKNIVCPEIPFNKSINNAIISGKIDLLVKNKNGRYTILEFKSGSHSIEKERAAMKQITLYAISLTNYEVTDGIIYFFGSGGKRKDFKVNKNQMQLDIFTAITVINKQQFKPDTRQCKDCVFNDYKICPFNKNTAIKNASCATDFDDENDDIHADINGVL